MNLSDVKQAAIEAGLLNIEVNSHDMDRAGVIVGDYENIPIVIALTNEKTPRVRISVNVCDQEEVMTGLTSEDVAVIQHQMLDLNTEIDPVSIGVDTTNPDVQIIQARSSLRVVDLQQEEVVAEIHGVMASLASIRESLVLTQVDAEVMA